MLSALHFPLDKMLRRPAGAGQSACGHEPATERLEGPEGLVNARRVQSALAEAGEKRGDRGAVERGEVIANVGTELLEPGAIDAHCGFGAAADLLPEHKGLREGGERSIGPGPDGAAFETLETAQSVLRGAQSESG